MNNLKEINMRKAIWHIKRCCEEVQNLQSVDFRGIELFHLYSCLECLENIIDGGSNIYFIIVL